MLSKRKISEIKSLRQIKFRKESGMFVIEGEKVVRELLNSDFKVKLVAGLPDFLRGIDNAILPDEVYEISNEELSKISALASPNKVIALAEIPPERKVSFSGSSGPVLMVDGINDPGNLGTIIRTAEWFGVKALYCSEDSVDCFNAKVVQSAMGSLFRLPISYCSLPDAIIDAKNTGLFRIIGATLSGQSELPELPENQIILVVGSESHGITNEVLSLLELQVTINPSKHSQADSLNVAVACGVLLHSLLK